MLRALRSLAGAVLALSVLPSLLAAATITGSSSGGVGFVTSSSGPNGIDAQIGQWDTAFPNGSCGGPGGTEPDGQSLFTVDIDVQAGGLISFSYQLASWDNGPYDWLDIYLDTPGGLVSLVSHLGNPSDCWGLYWASSRVTISQSLDQWANQQVHLVFAVTQDGYGDQTQALINGIAIRNCSVPPLTPLSATAQQFENDPNAVDTAGLTPAMQTALDCIRTAVQSAGGTFTLNSAYRAPEYQTHLQEVWDKWQALKKNRDPECQALRAQIQAEVTYHQIINLARRPAGPSGPHTRGVAFDANVSGANQDVLAANCGLFRPYAICDAAHPHCDPIHFQLR